uniref:Uncharacterized protein n=1 Tax=Anguilla anguilla TaxID=7936 RepID=A0A0E9VFE1_ANGAN
MLQFQAPCRFVTNPQPSRLTADTIHQPKSILKLQTVRGNRVIRGECTINIMHA